MWHHSSFKLAQFFSLDSSVKKGGGSGLALLKVILLDVVQLKLDLYLDIDCGLGSA